MDPYEKFLWIELIGFDNTVPDFGVGELLARMPKQPAMVSLLLWSAEIIHSHSDLREDAPLGAQQCSYYARPCNEERMRQDWTKFQLRGLIRELRKQGVAVFLSVFDQVMSEAYAQEKQIPRKKEWVDSHNEVFYVTADGMPIHDICPWKRLSDGTFYEDFFLSQLEKLLTDYGFDGFHAADGYGHPRLPLHQGDFSDDVVEQFSVSRGITVPGSTIPERAAWILSNAREQWTVFHAKRHRGICEKLIAMLNRNGKGHVFNTTWTRDPLEAYLRYGIDYRQLAEAGVREFVVEAQAAVIDLEGWNHSAIPMLDQYRAMMIRLKSQLPDVKMHLLNCVKDGMEQYNALRHAPTRMESDIDSMMNLFYDGKRALAGVMTCLSDGIRPWEWERIDETYRRAFDQIPESVPGITVLWSESAHRAELSAYLKTPYASSFRLFSALLAAGAPLFSGASAETCAERNTPLLILNPIFWHETLLDEILQKSKAEVLLFGLHRNCRFSCQVWKNGKLLRESEGEAIAPSGPVPYSWIDELPEIMPEPKLISECAEQIRCLTEFDALDQAQDTRLWGFYHSNGVLRLLIGNQRPTYRNNVSFRQRSRFRSVKVLTEDPSLPPTVKEESSGTVLTLKLPPSGTVILDLFPSRNNIRRFE